ncbi:MAG: hypothetical protein UY35_C0007G0049 [Candidatus Saccharibacteria bacterium GW2011_GWC2_48_9]|nr:MAG: hypothetical protein UY35_C0007G0049 [Candidatus Saccharibacteria bacterium GW2011_GWC2_48_9]
MGLSAESLVLRSECGLASDSATKSRYVVAVSGGVDSVVLLDAMHRRYGDNLVVAHVDHGIRPSHESGGDARFVQSLAERYGLPFELIELALGEDASEEQARDARYAFLRKVSKKYKGPIVTAHHADDVVETVAINLLRGTGWRGLAVFGADDVYRPLTVWFKSEITDYARRHGLDWREDSTNASDKYLRNRVREKAASLPMSAKLELLALWRRQHELKVDILHETHRHATFRRHPYIMMDPDAAIEVLAHACNVPLTRPQLHRAVIAIKTAKAGSKYSLTKNVSLKFGLDDFQVLSHKK